MPRLRPELQARLDQIMARMPADWRVLAVRQLGRNWVVDLTNESGQPISHVMLFVAQE